MAARLKFGVIAGTMVIPQLLSLFLERGLVPDTGQLLGLRSTTYKSCRGGELGGGFRCPPDIVSTQVGYKVQK
jgi:hypothetical protein